MSSDMLAAPHVGRGTTTFYLPYTNIQVSEKAKKEDVWSCLFQLSSPVNDKALSVPWTICAALGLCLMQYNLFPKQWRNWGRRPKSSSWALLDLVLGHSSVSTKETIPPLFCLHTNHGIFLCLHSRTVLQIYIRFKALSIASSIHEYPEGPNYCLNLWWKYPRFIYK